MNKAKAWFAAGIIVIVAGVSAVCLYLNNAGKLAFGEDSTAAGDVGVIQVADDNADDNNQADKDNSNSDQVQTGSEDNDVTLEENAHEDDGKVDIVSLNEFLSTFSKLYFAQDRGYDRQNADYYELLRFAYLYATVFEDREAIVTGYFDDEVGVYNGISALDAQRIINKFFGIPVPEESVYTEKTYQFFMYRDGYFYTPAADGVGFTDITIVDSAVKSSDMISVSFTVYSDGVTTDMSAAKAKKNGTVFSQGSAHVYVEDGEYMLMSYEVEF